MRKNMNYLASMAVTALLALTACNEEAALTQPAEPQNPPVADNSGNVYITGDDFTWELGGGEGEGDASSVGAVTRSQLIVDGNTARFAWTPGDRVGILPDQGAQVWFEIPTPEEGEEPTNVATFDGGAWALKPTSKYAAYYPFVKDFDLDRTAVPVSYTGQAQTGNGSTAHLGAYDYQGARPSTTNGAGGVSFDFDHVGALVLLQFTVPTGDTRLTGVTLSADGAAFTTAGTYDLTSTEGFPITATDTAESMTIGLDYTTTADDETVTLYFLCAPIDLSGKTVSVSVACGGTEGETIELQAEGKNLVAAGGYLMEAKIPYLTFAADAKQTFTMTANGRDGFNGGFTLPKSLEYSVGDGDWTQLTSGTEITFGGDKGTLRLRGKSSIGTAKSRTVYSQIAFGDDEVEVACTGDIRTLVDWEYYATASTTDARFCLLFDGCTSLTTAPELPADTLAIECYYSMFNGCTALTTAPELPAETLAKYCYNAMFNGCTSLTTAPELSAETLAGYCYRSMFNGCTALTTAPAALPAETLETGCYQNMFYGCTSLTTAPELPATTLAKYCYQYMFYGCTSLTTAPVLPATTLADYCYQNMFNGCTNLSSITMLATDISATSCLYQWVNGVASSGTFYKNGAATWTKTGTSGIPTDWDVETYVPTETETEGAAE